MDAVYNTLRRRILRGELPTATTLVENALAAEFGVSRTPVREALRRLEQDGLLQRVNRGLQVREPTPGEVLDVLEVRTVLEATAARFAAARRSDLDVVRMRGRHEAMLARQQLEPPELAEQNRLFHRAVWRASGNGPLVEMLDQLALQTIRHPFAAYRQPERVRDACEEHARILEAIIDRDSERAWRETRHHLSVARTLRVQSWSWESDHSPSG